MKLALAILPLITLSAWSSDVDIAMGIHRIEIETADRIQTGIVNPILGPGRGFVFVRLELTVEHQIESSDKGGQGRTTSTKLQKPGPGSDLEIYFSSSTEIMQEARQVKNLKDDHHRLTRRYAPFEVIILHDLNVPRKKLEVVSAALTEVYKGDLKITLRPLEFNQEHKDSTPPN